MSADLNYSIIERHISVIKNGEAILHNDCIMTVSNNNIKRGGLGLTIFGDSYHCGYKPVKLVEFKHVKAI